VELTPLGAGDEDEDMALFDMTAVKSRPWSLQQIIIASD
jgi:hypothetical protein